ncbi:MAG: UbiA family prenyltransferase [Deltaproteobacteria bacterium]|nr:UbiA family prenyltransferase [Deltaproteobacteria bacterium]
MDLDGTLLRGDSLWESLAQLLREQPATLLLRAPFWLLRGRAGFKAAIADRVQPDARHLPYSEEVLTYVRQARADGRRVVLASASDRRVVAAVADHLGLFDDVIGTEANVNCSGRAKLAAIRERAGGDGFEYIGNSGVDVPIWERAQVATVASPTSAARRWAASQSPEPRMIPGATEPLWRSILGELRPHQWAKNALLFAPLLLAHQLADPGRLRAVIVAFVSFCAIASAGYVVNDLVDVDADRRHPTKRLRPIATAALPMPIALALIAGLLASGFAISLSFVSLAATGMLAAYLVLTLCYSFYFKRQLLLDVLVLAGLYTHRVLTGGVAAEVPVSPWLLAFSTFFFLSLALVKRYVELLEARELEREHIERRAYQVADLGLVETMGLSCGYIAVLVLCLFVSSDDVSRLYSAPVLLWLMCPVMLYWISRIWFLARRGELHDDPVLFATRDRISFVCGVLVLAVVLAATVL